MSYLDYENVRHDDPQVQAEFQRLLEAMAAAERARAPIQQRHRQAEQDLDTGHITEAQFRAIDDQYIAANNKIAAAKKAVDAFLTQHRDYRAT